MANFFLVGEMTTDITVKKARHRFINMSFSPLFNNIYQSVRLKLTLHEQGKPANLDPTAGIQLPGKPGIVKNGGPQRE